MYVVTYSALAAALFLLFYLTGHAATRRLAPPALSAAPEEKAALRLVMGVAVWVTLLFALAALQRLRPAPIAALTAAAAAWGLWSVWKARARRADPRQPASSIVPRDPLAILLLAVVAIALAALWAQTLRPIVAWDADVYHLTIPRLYLEHGGFRRIPFNVYSNWPLAVQLLYALAMVVKDYVLATALHFGFGVALIALLGVAAARATTPLWGTIAAASLLLHPVFLFEIRVAYVDVACAFFLFAAFLALHRALEDAGEERRWIALSGVACGVLAAAKLNGVFGALCIATAIRGVAVARRHAAARAGQAAARVRRAGDRAGLALGREEPVVRPGIRCTPSSTTSSAGPNGAALGCGAPVVAARDRHGPLAARSAVVAGAGPLPRRRGLRALRWAAASAAGCPAPDRAVRPSRAEDRARALGVAATWFVLLGGELAADAVPDSRRCPWSRWRLWWDCTA